jgi:precorrin-4 C11-methyltransferase
MKTAAPIALIAVTRGGVDQARLLRQRLRAGELYRPERFGVPQHGWESTFAGPLPELVAEIFNRVGKIVFFLAAGAVTRLIAPCLRSKDSDPAVLAVDEAGQFVIPLLGGHKGGGNTFARTVAGCLGATPVITTASDVIGGLSLDLLEDALGWTATPRELLKPAARALVEAEPVAIVQEIGCTVCWLDEMELPPCVVAVRDGAALADRSFAYYLWVTDRLVHNTGAIDAERVLWYRPPSLVLGIGCERGISRAALEDGLQGFLRQHGYASESIAAVASLALKADEMGLLELVDRHGWPTMFYTAEELAAVTGLPHPSEVVARCVGTPGVAEPAALLAAGAKQLLVEKQMVSSTQAPQRMTFALARLAAYEPVAPQALGKVIFVGAGPGDPDLLTLKGRRALAQADVIIYAGSLVPEKILDHAGPRAVLCNSAPLTLEEVMHTMTEAVRTGKRVVRLHSGDTSLYSAIQEQMAILDQQEINFEVIPGVSSFQAAAAALGAELTVPEIVQTVILTRAGGQTPMPAGEALAELARHQATMCIFLSASLADEVQEQLLAAYPADTPAAILYRVSWPDEIITLTTLGRLAEEIKKLQLSRTTLIMVGPALDHGRQKKRSRLYDRTHGHIFRKRSREQTRPSA